MKKDAARDYATNAFRMYSSLSIKARDELCSAHKNHPAVLDIIAVDKMLKALKKQKNGDSIEAAVTAVYFRSGKYSFARGQIAKRVKTVCTEIFVSEIQVYRYLRYARELFCKIRGLCTENDTSFLLSLAENAL